VVLEGFGGWFLGEARGHDWRKPNTFSGKFDIECNTII